MAGGREQREHFRIAFPPEERPQIDIGGQRFPVIDLSEGGVKFELPPKTKSSLRVGEPFQASIHFRSPPAEPVKGTVVRVAGSFVILRFSQGVALKRMHEEHRKIIQKYTS